MRSSRRSAVHVRAFLHARRGATAVFFAIMLVPVLLASGVAVDFGRLEILKASLQSVADGAALAGASALSLSNGSSTAITVANDYYVKGAAALSSDGTMSAPTVTEPSTIAVTVTGTATLTNTLMSIFTKSMTVTVSASAEGPAYQLSVTKTGGLSSSSYDSNSIYYYDATTSTTPPVSAMTLLLTNDSSVGSTSTSSQTVAIGANDTVGFALVNKTGGLTGYGGNAYGSNQGTTQIFYSALTVPSALAYSASQQGKFYTGTTSTHKNTTTCTRTPITGTVTDYVSVASDSCNAHPCTELYGSSPLENNLLIGGSCSTPSSATQTCLSLSNTPLTFMWNDMGGGSDDYDYNDAVYKVTCTPTTSTTNQPKAVVLVQ